MKNIPGHTSPPYSEESKNDALFHYTTANGLIGILGSSEIWSTAYYCANDEDELVYGNGVLKPIFREVTHKLKDENDPRINTLLQRGTDLLEFSDNFEKIVTSRALTALCAYITCFCKPIGEEDFKHGLLSQWRGYGSDGGYAIQFSKKKLLKFIEATNEVKATNYDLQDVSYDKDSPPKEQVLSHKESFVSAFVDHLNEYSRPLGEILTRSKAPNPLANLFGGPLESFLDYLVHTKNKHFSEERECRLSHIQTIEPIAESLSVEFFNRSGLIVPFTKTPNDVSNIVDCIEWIVIGPGPRLQSRMKSISQLIRQHRKKIPVRPSHIPFTRL